MRGNVKTGASYNSPTGVFKYGFKVGINYIRMIMTGVLLYRHETSAILKTGFDLVVDLLISETISNPVIIKLTFKT